NRFMKLNARHMTALDMQAWTAVRMVGEAISRTNSSDPKTLSNFLKGPDFSIAAFKGQRLTLRDWNLQLRQPILLVDGRMVVSVSPQEGFLHQVSELDTLGVDRPETKCKLHGRWRDRRCGIVVGSPECLPGLRPSRPRGCSSPPCQATR